ncbi:L-rhamnose mutarotase [Falsihalocynthiibacter sp. SS001]|uniref:L-rhamnose mutarotase n=1 Tax=Falsihalocynthiibacter sp. SS001 TaxID=3349698 RepID=UPI0036D3BA8C
MERMGMVIGLNADKIEEYKELHANAWPGVLRMISDCNIKNYTIFLREPENLLFSYWEYHGTDFAKDAEKMAADPETQRWWKLCGPCQKPLETREEGEWWASMEDVFHLD